VVDIGGIVDHHYLNFYQYQPHTITSKESLNSDGQQFHQYQQPPTITSKESLNSDGQQFHQHQPHTITSKKSLNSDGQQFHQYQHKQSPLRKV
jgi:hypothetical protein